MSVVSGAVITSVVAVNRNLGVANATMTDLAVAANGIERVGQLLRGAVAVDGDLTRSDSAIIQGGATDITFLTSTGTDPGAGENPVQYRLWVNADGDLVESRVEPVPATNDLGPGVYTAAPVDRVVIRDVLTTDTNGDPVSVFRYWSHYWDRDDNFDNVVDQPDSDRCGREITPAGSWLTADDAIDVDSVSFRLLVRAESNYRNTPVELRGWARFASAEDLGFSSSFDSAGCLDGADGGFGYDN